MLHCSSHHLGEGAVFSVGNYKSLSPVALVKNSILPMDAWLSCRDHAHFPSHVCCPLCLGLLLESSPHTVSALITWLLQSPILLLSGISPAPHHTASHQGLTVGGLAHHSTAFLSRVTSSSQTVGIKPHMARGFLPFHFPAGLSALSFPLS